MTGRRRVLDHVDAERDDPARPLRRLAEHDRQRHGEPVVDRHLVDEGEVELVDDERLGEVPGQFRMALHDGHGAGAVALVGGRELVGQPEGEGGDDLQRERGGVVVVDDDADVGPYLGHPGAGRLELGEIGRPVGLVGLALVDRRAHRGHVRAADATDEPGHQRAVPLVAAAVPLGTATPVEHHLRKVLGGHAGLLTGQVLEGHPVAGGQLVRVVHVAAQLEEPQPLAAQHGLPLLAVHGEPVEVGAFVGAERLAVGGLVQRHQELVERVAPPATPRRRTRSSPGCRRSRAVPATSHSLLGGRWVRVASTC